MLKKLLSRIRDKMEYHDITWYNIMIKICMVVVIFTLGIWIGHEWAYEDMRMYRSSLPVVESKPQTRTYRTYRTNRESEREFIENYRKRMAKQGKDSTLSDSAIKRIYRLNRMLDLNNNRLR